jgi:acyl-CoA thioesterase-1
MSAFLYTALGDSAGVGFGASDGKGYVSRVFSRLERAVPNARLLNLSISGATSSTVLDRQVDRAVASKPSLVTLFIGGNDLWRMVDPDRFHKNLEAIATRLDKTGAPVLLGNLANMSHAPVAAYAQSLVGVSKEMIEQQVKAFNRAVSAVASKHKFTLVDLFGVGIVDRPHYFCGDGFHPSSEGYAVWADVLWAHMEPVVAAAA